MSKFVEPVSHSRTCGPKKNNLWGRGRQVTTKRDTVSCDFILYFIFLLFFLFCDLCTLHVHWL